MVEGDPWYIITYIYGNVMYPQTLILVTSYSNSTCLIYVYEFIFVFVLSLVAFEQTTNTDWHESKKSYFGLDNEGEMTYHVSYNIDPAFFFPNISQVASVFISRQSTECIRKKWHSNYRHFNINIICSLNHMRLLWDL